MVGFDQKRFPKLSTIGAIAEDLVCSICLHVLCDPVDTQCLHTFCFRCLDRWLVENKSCPECHQQLVRSPRCVAKPKTSDRPLVRLIGGNLRVNSNLRLASIVDKLEIRCPLQWNGCPDVMPVRELAEHVRHKCRHKACPKCELPVPVETDGSGGDDDPQVTHNCVDQLKAALKNYKQLYESADSQKASKRADQLETSVEDWKQKYRRLEREANEEVDRLKTIVVQTKERERKIVQSITVLEAKLSTYQCDSDSGKASNSLVLRKRKSDGTAVGTGTQITIDSQIPLPPLQCRRNQNELPVQGFGDKEAMAADNVKAMPVLFTVKSNGTAGVPVVVVVDGRDVHTLECVSDVSVVPSTSSSTSSSSSERPKQHKYCILNSRLDDKQKKKIQIVCRTLNAEAVDEWSDGVTHLVIALTTDGAKQMVCHRNVKYLKALLANKWILTFDWITDSYRSNRFVAELEYEISADRMATETGVPYKSQKSLLKSMSNLSPI